jgi:hypothetical protein
MLKRIATTHAPAAVVLVRLMVGAVFLSEGIQKFLFPAEVGAGLREDRLRVAGVCRAICCLLRDCLRRPCAIGPDDSIGGDSAHRDHADGDLHDKI